MIERHAQWGDAGKIIPNIIVLSGPKIVDLSGLLDADQVVAVANSELEDLPSGDSVIILVQLP
jgi:hypothetical protein